HPAKFCHHPVGNAGWDATQPEIVDTLLAPAGYDVIALADLLEDHGDVGGVVLQVAIHSDDVLASCVVKSCGESGGLPEVAAQFHHRHTAVDGSDFAQQGEGAIDRSVVDKNDLATLAVRPHHPPPTIV